MVPLGPRSAQRPWPTPHRRLDLVAQEDPAPPELAAGQQPAPGIFEHGRDRQVQQVGDSAAVEDILARQPRMGRGGYVDWVHRRAGQRGGSLCY
jgi:hypothetical protein